MFKATKRFIAGAVCPKCSELDKLVMFKEEEKQYRECVSCGFRDEMLINGVGRELETRVNQTAEERDAVVQVLDINHLK